MKIRKILLYFFIIIPSSWLNAQESEIYTNDLVAYNHSIQLYENKDYYAAQILFNRIKDQFDDDSELRARSYYYRAFCAIKLGQKDGEELMREFVDRFPTSTKRNNAFLEVGNYFFNNGSYAYALKWFSRVDTESLNPHQREDFQFRFAYGLFASASYIKAKKYFSQLLDSKKYGAQAKYYYGYIAYKDDDYVNADKYFSDVEDDKKLGKDIPYFMANIKFKTGKFQEAIDTALPLLEKSNDMQRSELSKIIGESYFNLKEYDKAIPYLEDYKGKKGRWNNTDYYLLGYAYYQQKEYHNAMEWFSKIIDGNNAVSQNAYYHLAECYLLSNKKPEALNAFKNASQMDFDKTIKQDAWLNYAKLSYEIGNPYQSTAQIIQEYLKTYPMDIHKDDLSRILISSFIDARDYEGAVQYLKDKKDDENLQKVAFLRGIQLFDDQSFEQAIPYFTMAENLDNSLMARAVYWKAESNYRMGNYEQALKDYLRFNDLESARNTPEYKDINYNIAYAYFKIKDYNKAGGFFKLYTESDPENSDQKVDALMRLGDSFFALGNYFKALTPYEKVVKENSLNVDFAQFQIAMCYGFMGENSKKISSLNNFLKYNLKSNLRDDAFYELGNTYFNSNQTDKALDAYNSILSNYPQSAYVPKVLLKQGLVYFNTNKNNEAIARYKKVIQNYPESEEAREAVTNARQIYVDMGKVSEYEKLVKNVDFVNVSDKDIDDTMYESAEKQYLSNNRKKAVEGFLKYLKRFPNGLHALESNFYLADSYEKEKKPEKAVPYYKYVLDKHQNEFTEISLVNLSQIYLKDEKWKQAMPLLKQLEQSANIEKNKLYAQSNLMKGYYAQGKYDKAVQYAELLLKNEKIEAVVHSDAQIIIARSAFKEGKLEKARDAFKIVEKNASGKLKAEAIYYDAYFKHSDGDYKNSNVIVQKLASGYSNYRYWGAKGLVIMAKNFYELKDAYQATYILDNVIKNFADYPEVTQEAKIALQKIKKEQAKTNESVIQEN